MLCLRTMYNRTCLLCVLYYFVSHVTGNVYKLVWHDEFNGDVLDRSKWYHLVDCSGRGNRELQCYTNRTDNVQLKNGHLILTARREDYNRKQFTSGRIHTSGRGWKYGKFEARARLPKGTDIATALVSKLDANQLMLQVLFCGRLSGWCRQTVSTVHGRSRARSISWNNVVRTQVISKLLFTSAPRGKRCD